MYNLGEIPKWPKGADCKSVGIAFEGSNPSLTTMKAYIAQAVEHFHGKEEVTSSSLVVGSKNIKEVYIMFKENVLDKNHLVLVDFWAPWCKYCIELEPILKRLEDKFLNNFSVFKVNVDEHPDLAQKYDVMGLPSLIFFKDGEELDIHVTDRSEKALSDLISNNI